MARGSQGELEGRIALVVGGGQQAGETVGNGRAAALLYARAGAAVLVADLEPAAAEETVRQIVAEGGIATARQVDVTVPQDCTDLVAACIARHGRIDILHNNVGMTEGERDLVDLDLAVWDRLQDLNVRSVFLTVQAALPHMRRQGSGVITNISSIASVSYLKAPVYSTTKAAMNMLTRQVAIANAPHGIRCNVILPGFIDTPLSIERRHRERGIDRDTVRAERNAKVPLKGGMGSAWDVAHAALFLASDAARFITGVALPVDGGQSALAGYRTAEDL
ncbi:MAG: SDR family oxidoreductase [Sneathiellaceae bacterium]